MAAKKTTSKKAVTKAAKKPSHETPPEKPKRGGGRPRKEINKDPLVFIARSAKIGSSIKDIAFVLGYTEEGFRQRPEYLETYKTNLEKLKDRLRRRQLQIAFNDTDLRSATTMCIWLGKQNGMLGQSDRQDLNVTTTTQIDITGLRDKLKTQLGTILDVTPTLPALAPPPTVIDLPVFAQETAIETSTVNDETEE